MSLPTPSYKTVVGVKYDAPDGDAKNIGDNTEVVPDNVYGVSVEKSAKSEFKAKFEIGFDSEDTETIGHKEFWQNEGDEKAQYRFTVDLNIDGPGFGISSVVKVTNVKFKAGSEDIQTLVVTVENSDGQGFEYSEDVNLI